MSKRLQWKRHILISLALFALFWVADALIDAVFWGGTFFHEFLSLEPRELYMRGLCSSLIALFLLPFSVLLERRHLAEANLKKSDELSRIFFDSTTDAVCFIDGEDLTIQGANGIFLESYGLSEREAGGMSFPELVRSRRLPEEMAVRLKESAASGISACHEIVTAGKGGETLYREISIHPIGSSRLGAERVLHVTRDVTLQRRSESLLKESEARYRSIFESTGTALAIIRPDGVLHMVNREFEALTGYGRQELEGQLLLTQFIDKKHRTEMLRRLLLPASELAARQSFELQTVDRFGATRTMAGNWSLLADGEQAILSLVDIGEQKLVEEALRQSRTALAMAQRIARLGTWEWDLKHDTLGWSEEMYRIFSVDPEGFRPTQEWILQTVHPQDRETAIRSMNDAIYNRKPYQLDYRVLLAGGEVRMISAQGEVTYDAQGVPLRMLGTNQDVTWRHQAEQALRSSEEKFSKAFQASPDAIVISRVDDGTYIDVNEAFLEHTGYARDEVLGKSSLNLEVWADPEARMAMLQLLNRYGHVRNHDVRFRMKSGEIRQLLWSADVMEYLGAAHLIAVSKDVTDQRNLEKELSESEAKLFMKHEELIKLFRQMESIRREWEETMDCLSDMFIVADESGRIRRFNRALETFTGKAHREIVGREYLPFLEEQGLRGHLEAPGVNLAHAASGRRFVLKRYAFSCSELEGSTREVIIINDTSGLALPPL